MFTCEAFLLQGKCISFVILFQRKVVWHLLVKSTFQNFVILFQRKVVWHLLVKSTFQNFVILFQRKVIKFQNLSVIFSAYFLALPPYRRYSMTHVMSCCSKTVQCAFYNSKIPRIITRRGRFIHFYPN